MSEGQNVPFRLLLRQERKAAGMSQEDLGGKSKVSWRGISDLETGRTTRPREYTVHQLADALGLTGVRRDAFFEAAGHGRASSQRSEAAQTTRADRMTGPAQDTPQEWLAFIVRTLDRRGPAAAQSAVAAWKARASTEPAWTAWASRLIALATEGRLQPVSQRPVPTARDDAFLGRQPQLAELSRFVQRVTGGRGGLGLVIGRTGIGKSRLVLEALSRPSKQVHVEWLTLDRSEAGYRGWSRLLAPLWTTVRLTELAPTSLLPHAGTLDDVLFAPEHAEMARQHLPGVVADAIAALLIHVSAGEAMVVVIDDAHRGGGSSDRLLIELARRLNAHCVGIVAALRPDELEQGSPLAPYCAQAGDRSAADMVVPIHLPALGRAVAATMIQKRTRAEPPPEIVDEVLAQTGGCPQFINSIEIHPPRNEAPGTAWVVGKFDPEGVRALESTITGRSDLERTILEAAAVCATGGFIDPATVAAVADLDPSFVEAVLDKERRHGPVLMAHARSYCFQHDNWIDALTYFCRPGKLRSLHARYLSLLRADQAPDPRHLAQHAISAGSALVGETELVTLVTAGADLAVCDYAFGLAAEWYEIAARHASGGQRIDLLIRRSDAMRFSGLWSEARTVLRQAVEQATTLSMPDRTAVALIHLERLTWSYGLDEQDLTDHLRRVLGELPPADTALRAQVQAALAMRLGITHRPDPDDRTDLAQAALKQLPAVKDPLAQADIIISARHGLEDAESPERMLELDRQALSLARSLHSAYHTEEALTAVIVDTLRSGKLLELPAAIREHRHFARKNTTPPVVYSQELIEAMLALARGDFEEAEAHTSEALRQSAHWGESMAGEALMAQTGWRLYETGQVDGLADFLAALPQRDVSSLNDPVWALGAAIIHAETNDPQAAIPILRSVCAETQDFRGIPRGPARIGILAAAAMALGHPAICETLPPAESARIASSLCGLLAEHPDELVIAGWPAVLLGSKHRFIGLAHLAAAQPADAADHLARAATANNQFAVLHTRTNFDLARALILQPNRHDEGVTLMAAVKDKAADLRMANLAKQAATALAL